MLRWFFILLTVITFQVGAQATGSSATASSSVKGFQEWKSEKVQAALTQMSSTRLQIQKAQSLNDKRNADSLEKQLDQLKWNLEVAQDLSVTDYFVLYLSQQTQSDRYQQAASKMSTKEVAQLMEAYANTLSNSPSEVVVRPSKQTALPVRLPVQAIQNPYQVK